MKNLSFAFKYLKLFRKNFAFGLVLAFLCVVLTLILPNITQMFIDSVLDISNTNPEKISPVWQWIVLLFSDVNTLILVLCLSFVVVAILKNLCEFGKSQNFYKASSRAGSLMRTDCFNKLAHLNNYTPKSETYVNFTGDINEYFRFGRETLPRIFMRGLSIIFSLLIVFLVDFRVGLVFLITTPLVILTVSLNLKKLTKNFETIRTRRSRMQEKQEDAVSEIREVKIFHGEKYMAEQYEKENEKHKIATKNAYKFQNKIIFLADLIKIFGLAFAIIFSAISCFSGELTVGFFVLMVSYAFIISNSASDFNLSLLEGASQLVRVGRVRAFLNKRSEFKDGKQVVFAPEKGIKFENVSAVLGGRRIFKNLNLNLEFGKSYGIYLSQGDGKSALAKLILKFFEIENGKISIDDIDYKNVDVYSLRKQISYISQEAYIFETSLISNIIMFSQFDEEKYKKAIEICALKKLNQKCDFKTSKFLEKGAELTTQDKQKINFARAIYKNAPILLIDSAFNKFSPSLTQKFLEGFLSEYKNRMVIILSNKMSDLNLCDEILTIENGCVKNKPLKKSRVKNLSQSGVANAEVGGVRARSPRQAQPKSVHGGGEADE